MIRDLTQRLSDAFLVLQFVNQSRTTATEVNAQSRSSMSNWATSTPT